MFLTLVDSRFSVQNMYIVLLIILLSKKKENLTTKCREKILSSLIHSKKFIKLFSIIDSLQHQDVENFNY